MAILWPQTVLGAPLLFNAMKLCPTTVTLLQTVGPPLFYRRPHATT